MAEWVLYRKTPKATNQPNAASGAHGSYGRLGRYLFGEEIMITSRECRERAAECREMAKRELNAHVRTVLNDMARSWERLALQTPQFTNRAQMGFSFGTSTPELE